MASTCEMWSWLFKGKKTIGTHDNTPTITAPIVNDEFIIPQTAENLLSNVRCDQLLKAIWQRTSLSDLQFKQLYLNPH
ncbi:hypothetical protein [Gilliamella sp. Fer1-1]|jgi:hypothetical protein|uniref:hypothetical protein n=1 Tax=Gilliamella sp. Fer1-1 TaxID=3120240 RepID=UPI0026EC5E9A|nr:hypothetical protein [Gilliamella apicola]